MRKFLSFIFGMVLLSLLPQKAWCQEAYAWLSEDGKTLTFCYDGDRATRSGTTYDLNEDWQSPGWQENDIHYNITKVKFDPSFADVKPTTTYCWFELMTSLTDISGLQYLNTSQVSTMASMFWNCRSLKSLDLSHFNTSKVSRMERMFQGCEKLRELNLSNFDFSSVNSESQSWGSLGSFLTEEVFNGLIDLRILYIPSSISEFSSAACSGIGSEKFPCIIYAPDDFDFGVDVSEGVFQWKSGFFKFENVSFSPLQPYTCESGDGKTLTAYYDSNRETRDNTEGFTYGLDRGFNRGYSKIVFDPSFKNYIPTNMYGWFNYMNDLNSIEGISNINTSEVTNMGEMFIGCNSLKELDLSSFITSNVVNMDHMFAGCGSLTSLDVSNFETSKVTSFAAMFNGCSSLTSLNVSNFDTSNAFYMYEMFQGCKSLTSLDVSSFNVSRVVNLYSMFKECSGLKSLDVSNFDMLPYTAKNNSHSLFLGCNSLTSLSLNSSMAPIGQNACEGVGTIDNPCFIIPKDVDLGLFDDDIFGDYFVWKSGFFKVENGTPLKHDYFTGQITVERKYKVHKNEEGNDFPYHYPGMSLIFNNDKTIAVGYFDADHWSNPIHGIYIMYMNEGIQASLDYIKAQCLNEWYIGPVVQDEWITEKLIVNADGRIQYYMNGDYMGEEFFDQLNLDRATSFYVSFTPWGYGKGHYQYMDDFNLITSNVTIQDNFDDGVIDLSIWQPPYDPEVVREEDGILKMEQLESSENLVSLPIKLEDTTPLVTLSNGDNEVPLSEYDGMTVDVELGEYTCQPEKWYSLCVPFDISNEQLKEAFGDDVDIQEMTGCAWNASEQILDMNFNKVTEVLAGRPYLLRVAGAVDAPQFDGVTINSDDPLTLNFGNCTMTGVLNATPLPLGDKSYLFIINNKFYYPATTNPLPAMRCYFHLLGDAAQANSIALNMEDDADGIVSVISDSAADSRVYYSVQGVSTTRPTHGIYINNGKKVVIK